MVFSRLNEIGVGRFNNHIFAFFRLFSADHSFEERLVKFGVTIEFKFVDIVATFLSVSRLVWVRPYHFFLRREGVLGIGHLVDFLFH